MLWFVLHLINVMRYVFDVVDANAAARKYLGSWCTVVASHLWGCCLKCLVKLLVEICFIVFKFVCSGYKLHIRYTRARLEAESKAGKRCIELQFHGGVPVSMQLLSNWAVWWGDEREGGKICWGLRDVDVGWLGSYPDLCFTIPWFLGQQVMTHT